MQLDNDRNGKLLILSLRLAAGGVENPKGNGGVLQRARCDVDRKRHPEVTAKAREE
ncbi:hypothetical protein LFL96_32535 [Paraburkholderia sp. D15]|uniref:hypothetical protein n=1 Tax=Paraburkholderia sp. D15 TaxID=2880218 RepID=UPI002478B5D0|nr:hypothetical protein [Paraburkholderia sp. D15]WGS52903.1 hypothetical protein LFL96_32535 [Paraburkholderia sp. D15]